MSGLFVMPENSWRELRRRKTETELYSTLLKIVEWTSWKFSIDTGQGMNLSDDYKPAVEGYTALACLGGRGNGSAAIICNPNGWIYNTGVKFSGVSVTYQWLFIKNL